jgi:hypothetical protein
MDCDIGYFGSNRMAKTLFTLLLIVGATACTREGGDAPFCRKAEAKAGAIAECQAMPGCRVPLDAIEDRDWFKQMCGRPL